VSRRNHRHRRGAAGVHALRQMTSGERDTVHHEERCETERADVKPETHIWAANHPRHGNDFIKLRDVETARLRISAISAVCAPMMPCASYSRDAQSVPPKTATTSLSAELDLLEDPRLRRARQCRCVRRHGPDLRLEELQEGVRVFGRVELQVDHDKGLITDGMPHPLSGDAPLTPNLGDGRERGHPGRQIGDRVFDVQRGHGRKVRNAAAGAHPRNLGFS
jgi:hypothetical protein